ncbi:hypothetical protein [Methanonatronarchaeum sp. AMET-Sl]|uniref:hypothetical protein n=1 Tax=Methanonatronarchaeum sp. AMET-Sl TaxID=3037654 RepID=UPI00244E0BAE|nr:hypothetical protein [Methanonatronarchaeum sp. AMET-Sl]WGI17252.1 hypothetical protein QEN48_07045 [Methanonatronarchaeum sp. AMET-Sl]
MTELVTTNSGFFPRPDYLIDAYKKTGGLQKEGMADEVRKELREEISSARKEIVEIQENAETDLITEGQLHWDDLLAYPATKIQGIEMGGLIRYYNTNRFYRRPSVKSDLKTSDIVTEEYKKTVKITDKPVKPILPGPLTFSDLLENQHYDSDEEMMEKITEIIINEIHRLEEAGAKTIQIDEPFIATTDRTLDLNPIERIYNSIDIELQLHTYFGGIKDIYPSLLDKCDCIGLDLTDNNENWSAITEYGVDKNINAGIVTAKNTKIESKKSVDKKIDKILTNTSPEKLYITTDTGLDFLPWKIMLEKIKFLGSDFNDR